VPARGAGRGVCCDGHRQRLPVRTECTTEANHVTIWSLALAAALADGASADVEMIRPSLSSGAILGVDSPMIDRPRSYRIALYSQYEKDPLELWVSNEKAGNIVGNRALFDLGLSYDAARNFSLSVRLPVALSWGSMSAPVGDGPLLSADGFALGDVEAGVRLQLVQKKAFSVAGKLELGMPVGTDNAWLSEPQARITVGPLLRFNIAKKIAINGELTLTGRTSLDTGAAFVNGSTLNAGVGARYRINDKASILANLVGRAGLSRFLQGGAENGAEVLVGSRIWPLDALAIDLAVGRGLGDGAGTTDFRGLIGVTWQHRGPKYDSSPEPVTPIAVAEPVLEDKPVTPDQPEMPSFVPYQWKESELARIEGSNITLRDPIKFEINTVKVLPESLPTLQFVATLLDSQSMLIIEGHASEDGAFDKNYELSLKRARSIWEELIKAGVPPSQLSYRGLGEVSPVADDREANRSVVFYLVKLQPAPGVEPKHPLELRLPWSGEAKPVRVAPAPAPPPEKPTGDER
jgi:outer membrane protein OmpA-like peptidoglycan-associated protein